MERKKIKIGDFNSNIDPKSPTRLKKRPERERKL